MQVANSVWRYLETDTTTCALTRPPAPLLQELHIYKEKQIHAHCCPAEEWCNLI